jgi:hypothetical protein
MLVLILLAGTCVQYYLGASSSFNFYTMLPLFFSIVTVLALHGEVVVYIGDNVVGGGFFATEWF